MINELRKEEAAQSYQGTDYSGCTYNAYKTRITRIILSDIGAL